LSLSTIMGNAGLSGYAIVAMILFLAVFTSLMIRLWRQSRTGRLEEAGAMPLDDGRPAQGAEPSAAHREETR
jgi:hypothetical protein